MDKMKVLKEIADTSKASQNKQELLTLLSQVGGIKPTIIVEIGVHTGYLLETWRKAFPDSMIFGIENDMHDFKIGRDIYGQTRIIEGDSHHPKTLKDLETHLGGEEIDFLFIDGDHMYEGVKKDFEMYSPLVKSGGIIALHDVVIKDNPGVEVFRFWEEVRQGYRNVTIHYEGGTGTGILYI